MAWNICVNRPESLLQRAVKLHQDDGKVVPGDGRGSQKGDALPRSGRRRRGFDQANRRPIAYRLRTCPGRQEQMRDILQSPSKWPARRGGAGHRNRVRFPLGLGASGAKWAVSGQPSRP
jgi:hypothetical protein